MADGGGGTGARGEGEPGTCLSPTVLSPSPPTPTLAPSPEALTLLSFPSSWPSFSLPLPLPPLSVSVIYFLGRSTASKADMAFLCLCVRCACGSCVHMQVCTRVADRGRCAGSSFIVFTLFISVEAGSLPDPGAREMPLSLLPGSPGVADSATAGSFHGGAGR